MTIKIIKYSPQFLSEADIEKIIMKFIDQDFTLEFMTDSIMYFTKKDRKIGTRKSRMVKMES